MRMLYRGPLASCNYDCPYCPFAKRHDPPDLLRADRAALRRFVGWIRDHPGEPVEVLFTPWGEGLTRSWYREALVELSHLPHVARAVIQTNLSARLGWVADADPATLALWCTYHPGQVTLPRFLAACATLHRHGIRHSVGVVGLPEHHAAAVALRRELPPEVYLWVNAADGHSYTPAEEAAWTALDPLFAYSVSPHASRGRPCRTGTDVVSVLGDGTVRRCHFVPQPLGNLYDGTWEAARGTAHPPLPAAVAATRGAGVALAAPAPVPVRFTRRRPDHAVGDHAVGDHAVGDHAVGDHAVGDHAVGDHAVRDHAVRDEAMAGGDGAGGGGAGRGCPNDSCDCHIGYVHLETLPLYEVFAGGVLERIPCELPPRPPSAMATGRL